MNTPNYIFQNNNQTRVSLRPMYESMGFAARHFPGWIDLRIKNLSLVEGKDFRTFNANRHVQYETPLAVALSILATVPGAKAEPVKKELSDMLTTENQSEQTEAQNESVATTTPEVGSLFASVPVSPPAFKLTGPVAVMQIEGRAAVNAKDLFQLWNSIDSRSLSAWMNYRIESRGLIAGKHYAEFDVPAQSGHRRGSTGYILSIDAAILIADSEPKGKGKEVAAYLIDYRKDLAKQKLPNKAKLSDFVGMQPVNVVAFQTRDVQQDLSGDSFDVSGLGGGPELVNTPTGDNSGDGLFTQNGKNSDTRQTTQSEEFKEQPEAIAEEKAPEPQPQDNTSDPEAPNIFDLMVSFARGQLQQAEALSDLYRKMKATEGTVSALVGIGQQSALQTLGLSRGSAEIPVQTMRDKIRHAVNKRAAVTKETQESLFKLIYSRLYYDYGISIGDFPRQKDETHLMACERWGLLDTVWKIVDSRDFNQYATKAAA